MVATVRETRAIYK